LKLFLERVKKAHGDKYNYNEVTRAHILGHMSRVPVTCNKCSNKWYPVIKQHASGKSPCRRCAARDRMRPEKAVQYDLDYRERNTTDQVKEVDDHDKTQIKDDSIHLVCNKCSYNWLINGSDQANGKTGCPRCTAKILWTLAYIPNREKEIQNRFNYTLMKPSSTSVRDYVPIKCNTCERVWMPTIDAYVMNEESCAECTKQQPWTSRRFMKYAKFIHGDAYEYDQTTLISGLNSRVSVTCKQCTFTWNSTVHNHIINKETCCACIFLI